MLGVFPLCPDCYREQAERVAQVELIIAGPRKGLCVVHGLKLKFMTFIDQ